VGAIVAPTAHLYLWVPNALLAEGLEVMAAWGVTYKANIVWLGKTAGLMVVASVSISGTSLKWFVRREG